MSTRLLAVLGPTLLFIVPLRADDAADARAIVAKSIQAMGGEAQLGKFKAFTAKIKGEVHTQGMKIAFTGEMATQGADQERVALELEVDGQKFPLIEVLNRDKGWVKLGEETMEMDQDALAEALENAHAGWVAWLVPLKDRAFTLATLGEVKIDDKPAVGVRVSHKGRRDVSLFFDKSSHLLVKTETRVKDDETGQEVTQQSFMTGYEGKEVKHALKLRIMRDGKLFVEGELSDPKSEEKLDDSVFAKP